MRMSEKGKIKKDHSLTITLGILVILLVLPITLGFLQHSQQTLQYASAAQPNPSGPSGNWNIIFDDEFNGTSLNQSIWAPGWFGTGISGPVNTAETACYNSTQVSETGDGSLHLNLISQTSSCNGKSHPYTGSLVSSDPHDGISGHTGFDFTYGYIEWHVYLPPTASGSSTIANWPALWSDGEGTWPATGENDTMEGLSGSACYHFHSSSGGPGNCATGNFTGWHTFGSDWEPGSVTYYYDGVKVGQLTNVTSAPQYLIMTNTQGSYGGPTSVPATMLVDYVRVWQPCTTNCSIPSPTGVPSVTSLPTLTQLPTATPIPTVCGGLTVTAPLSLNKTTVKYGQTIIGDVTYTNTCQSSYSVSDVLIYAQSSNGTQYNFKPELGPLTVQPGQQVKVSASFTIPKNSGTGQWLGLSEYQNTNGTWVWDTDHRKTFNVSK
jgi:beta-glucanase (GH16 family)